MVCSRFVHYRDMNYQRLEGSISAKLGDMTSLEYL
jgi:hypothetical protein